jgi:hypothetical protein
MIRNNITEVAYNVQSTIDSKNNIPIDYKVTNQIDSKAMGDMVRRAKSIQQWGFSYILTKKGMERASSDVGFMFIAYNLRRIGNILTRDRLKEYLRILVLMFFDLVGINFSQFEEKCPLNLA